MKAHNPIVDVFRYEDSDHYPNLPTAQHHKHIGDTDMAAADPPSLETVLHAIELLVSG